MERRSAVEQTHELLFLKQGHDYRSGYQDSTGEYQDVVWCPRCGYQSKPTMNEYTIQPCMVEGE